MPFSTALAARVEHLLVEVDDPAWPLAIFAERLGLPVAWPVTEQAGATSAAVSIGDVRLVLTRFRTKRFGQGVTMPIVPPGEARLTGLALAPAGALPDVIERVQRRGLPIGHLDETPAGTSAVLPGLLAPPEVAYLFARKPGATEREAWISSGGGALGVQGVREVALVSRDPEAWSRLMLPEWPDGERYRLEAGPALRVTPGERSALVGLTLEVGSIARAEAALAERGLLGPAGPEGLTIKPAALGGLAIALAQR